MAQKTWDYSQLPGGKKYPHLFKPIKMGQLTIPNRIKYAATEDNLNDPHGFISDAGLEYMRERAKGVAGGLCTMQGVYMEEKGEGKGYVGMAGAFDDKFVPGLERMAEAIKGEGAISNIQLMHCGRVGGVEIPYCVGPSKIPQRLRVFKPVKEMSKEDIKNCMKQHAEAAERGVRAGFEVMEISGIVGYLISNFISSYTNRRTDEYGGDIEGRCQFMVETVQAVKDVIPKSMPLILRICAEELLDDVGGNTPEESIESYRIAEKAGVDSISVTQGWQESSVPVISRDIPQGTWLYNAERAKKAVNKAVITMAYRLFTPDLPNKAIGEDKLDMWENCRPQIADPLMPLKVLEGREEDVRPCVACNMCLARLFRDAPMTCYVNPVCAHEWDPKWQITPVETDKKVMIVGAGTAGLECAWVAAQRGHEVHVYDRYDKVGGQIIFAAKGPFGDDELYGHIDFQKAQCDKNGVEFHMGTEVTAELIDEEAPDTLVVATGADLVRDQVPGWDLPHVVSVFDVMTDKAKVGDHVVIWGGKKPGISAALHLSERKGVKDIAMVVKERKVGKDVNPSYVWRYIKKLANKKVRIYKESKIAKITDNAVLVKGLYDVNIPIKADTVVYAEREANRKLEDVAKEQGIEVYVIGDALVPRALSNSIHDGYRIGLRI
jgi:2,4-dienoyl-CoA reductase (NADPH2)